MTRLTRRQLLRGVVGGATVSVALPFLDVFLDGRGEALAGGAPLPTRFGTWFWGCGVNPDRWVPGQVGDTWEPSEELAAVARHQAKVTVLSGFDAPLGGSPNFPHHSGLSALRTGIVPVADVAMPGASFDHRIADLLGRQTAFRSLELSATGVRTDSYSFLAANQRNPAEVSPVAVYQRLFGGGASVGGDRTPDPRTLLRRSVLSAVGEDVRRLEGALGSHDRARLDQYLTSVRQLEQQLLVLAEPPDLSACVQPESPTEGELGSLLDQTRDAHAAMASLLALALACDRTRVFNVVFSSNLSTLRVPGGRTTHHQLTHDELVDSALGYQPEATGFVLAAMEGFATFLDALDGVAEGAGTVLDRCVVLAHSETSFAKTHDVSGIPMLLAGSGGGLLRTGQHLAGNGTPVTRVGLTLQQAMGLTLDRWGEGPLQTDRPLLDLFA